MSSPPPVHCVLSSSTELNVSGRAVKASKFLSKQTCGLCDGTMKTDNTSLGEIKELFVIFSNRRPS